MGKDNKRIKMLDGLRGIACIGVFTHHFLTSYFPATYYGNEAVSLTLSGIDAKLAYEPYGVFANGNFWVCVFLVLSAFVMSNQIFSLREYSAANSGKQALGSIEKLSSILKKRYFRLMIPVAIVGIAHYFLLKILVMTGLNYITQRPSVSFFEFLKHVFILMWTSSDSTVMGLFWMMHYLFFGSYLAILLALIVKVPLHFSGVDVEKKEVDTNCQNQMEKQSDLQPLPWRTLIGTYILYLVIAIAVYKFSSYYVGIVFGVMICYEYRYGYILSYLCGKVASADANQAACGNAMRKRKKKKSIQVSLGILIGVLCFVIGVFFGGYPSYVKPDNIYQIFDFYSSRNADAYQLIHCAGASALLISCFLLKGLDKMFSSKPVQWLGKYSFSVFLVHTIVLEDLGYFLIRELSQLLNNYSLAGIIVYIIATLLVLILSVICYHTAERAGTWVCSKIK